MLVEEKKNYNATHAGTFWAGEANQLIKEIINTFKLFISPSAARTDQMLTGINYLTMFNMWFGDIVDGEYTLYRKQELPIPDLIVGLTGEFRAMRSNNTSPLFIRFLNRTPIRAKFSNGDIPINALVANNIFKFIIMEDSEGVYMEIFNVTIVGDIIINEGSGRTVTTRPTLIMNNRFALDEPVNGDFVMNIAHVYIGTSTTTNGITVNTVSDQYDVKAVKVNPENPLEGIILDGYDGIDVNGRFAVVSYSV